MPSVEVYTIGYGADVFDPFLRRVKAIPEVTHLVDVRTNPYSRYQEDFRGETFAHRVRTEGLKYIFMGDSLGGKPTDPAVLTEGEVDPIKLQDWSFFQLGVRKIVDAAQAGKVMCLMCGCSMPADCHRGTTLGTALLAACVDLVHVLPDGTSLRQSVLQLPPTQFNLFSDPSVS